MGSLGELEGVNKEAMQHFISLAEEYDRTGEPVSSSPELDNIFAKTEFPILLYAILGQKENTLEALEQYFDEGKYDFLFYPFVDFLRSEPRFIALEQKRKQILGLEE